MLGAIGQSARSNDRAVLLKDEDQLFAQRSVDRVTIGRSRNEHLCAIDQSRRFEYFFRVIISRSRRTGFARSIDRAGMGWRDRPIVPYNNTLWIVQEKFCAINRSCRKILRDLPIVQENFARSTDRAGMGIKTTAQFLGEIFLTHFSAF